MSVPRLRLLGAAAIFVVLAACSGSAEPEQGGADKSATPSASASESPAAPTYKVKSKDELEDLLLGIDDLPAGWSQDPPTDEGNKYFCDYDPPAEEKFRASRDFTKGGGVSAELARVAIRQFESVEDAKASWDALVKALKTCKSEVYEGSELTYTPMSAPKVGDASAGVKIETDGTTLLQNFVLVGPVMISAGGGGLASADADLAIELAEAQVARYSQGAKQ